MKYRKYRAKRTTVDGITFASKSEAARYIVLKDMERTGAITHLVLQPKFILAGGVRYVADFEYCLEASGGQVVTEDVKGFKTPAYRIKAKLFKEKFGREIVETQMGAGAVNMILAAYKGVETREAGK